MLWRSGRPPLPFRMISLELVQFRSCATGSNFFAVRLRVLKLCDQSGDRCFGVAVEHAAVGSGEEGVF